MQKHARSPVPLLESIGGPAELRELNEELLPTLAAELRRFLLESVARSGGHLAAGLGTVELTIALHYLYDTPKDALVWDVGHQCYPHKILTGRRTRLHTIRQRGGLSGFLRRDESDYDSFGAGHSSTSVSAALGMALANERLGDGAQSVAIIGDGALTAGLAFEALNHAGASGADLTVVLNDNEMSISPNVGALCTALAAARAGRPAAARAFFGALGLDYFGPLDGHDLPALLAGLREVRAHRGPRLVHVLTQKGRGYRPAEQEPVRYHGVTSFDPAAGLVATRSSAPTYTQVFGDWLIEAAERDPRLVAITPAMREGSGLVAFAARFPDRYFDVGIAEQHAVTLAAGLAARGLRPVVAIYSTFLQRAYDQLVHDVALQGLPVLFAVDRAGLVGPDGATHNGCLDLSFLRCVPGLVVMAPGDGDELREMLDTGLALGGPSVVRYPRATAPRRASTAPRRTLVTGQSTLERRGERVAILSFGALGELAREVAERTDATLVNMRFVKPLDARRLRDLVRRHELIVTLEENSVLGGAGAAVAEFMAAEFPVSDLHGCGPVAGKACPASLLRCGVPDTYVEHGTREESLADCGLSVEHLVAQVRAALAGRPGPRRQRAAEAKGSASPWLVPAGIG
jgi:1-deoxy-D-xylulose-5-phosphate synthase